MTFFQGFFCWGDGKLETHNFEAIFLGCFFGNQFCCLLKFLGYQEAGKAPETSVVRVRIHLGCVALRG